jgi:indole-3-glycerol phosphate synthase
MTKDVLKEILKKKKERLTQIKQSLSLEEIKQRLNEVPPPRPFKEAISKSGRVGLIAEIKKASPSSGPILQDHQPLEIARIYEKSGACAISVLTEEDFFGGDLSLIGKIKEVTSLPILRKDFIIDDYQIYESRFYGADAVLLIADILSRAKLSKFLKLLGALGMDYILEVHSQDDLRKALSLKSEVIGVNNRNLHNLEVDLKVSQRLLPLVPKDTIVVVESGIRTYQDVLFYKILRANAVLVGEALLSSGDIASKISQIMGY